MGEERVARHGYDLFDRRAAPARTAARSDPDPKTVRCLRGRLQNGGAARSGVARAAEARKSRTVEPIGYFRKYPRGCGSVRYAGPRAGSSGKIIDACGSGACASSADQNSASLFSHGMGRSAILFRTLGTGALGDRRRTRPARTQTRVLGADFLGKGAGSQTGGIGARIVRIRCRASATRLGIASNFSKVQLA